MWLMAGLASWWLLDDCETVTRLLLLYLPQLAEPEIPRPMDVAGGGLVYDGFMKRVYLADAQTEERGALRLMLLDLNLQVVGEAADWPTALAQAPATRPDMVVVDWDLVAKGSGATHSTPLAGQALAELRLACPTAVVIVLISHLDARQQAAFSAGADAFISKSEMPDRVAERLRAAAGSVAA
jgi:DNA-binding NarL/FixJ family response regulator